MFSLPNNSSFTATVAEEDDIDDNLKLLKKRTAQIWETILTQFNLEDFSLLLSRRCFVVTENIHSILFNKAGSRIFEQLIIRCLFLCHQIGNPTKQIEPDLSRNEKLAGLDKFWKEFVKSICSDSSHFMTILCNCNASHVLRSFLLGAVGFMKEGSVVDENEILRGVQRLENVNRYFASLVECFWDTVDNLYQKIAHITHLSDVYASLVLQSLLFSKLLVPTRQSCFLHQLFSLIANRKGTKKNNFLKMACHAVTSHLLQAFFYILEYDLFQELFDNHLRNQIPYLLNDKYGNHVLQQIIRKQKDIPKVLDIYDKLEPHIDDLVSIGHFGILAALAEGLVSCEVGAQKTYVRKVAKALNCAGKTSCELVRNLLYPTETTRANFMHIAEQIPGNFEISQNNTLDELQKKVPKCSPVGSLLIQHFLKYSASGRQLVEESFVRFEKAQLLFIALDPSGSRAVESFLSSCGNFSLLNRFIDKFTGVYSILAKNCNGFHVLLKMFTVIDVKGKRKLVQELAATRLWLAYFPYGNQTLTRLKVNEFVRRQEQWSQKETTIENRKRLFKDILDADISEYENYPISNPDMQAKMKYKRDFSGDRKDHRAVKNNEDKSEDSSTQLELILECIRNVST
ncbi:pumilio/Puf RNA-binding domain-containing protein [Galdieria sulphuraria]|uniref:Pumilio/Puf RNA-binding domain-containing protein n=1 Tax=Galdieria sulphuraria TaxID=130081 RepID=M2X7F8_GALSU|nr:pumilio/Puf RNA-binding domain-containing protein [Galdieria sulphuraria]EME32450.1 pumilio/Puf RNA-binding domain-containing protein [Galdieria sulphuraria]|eukprot:XP_005708970.1 pumilio/Puf RNA-binding domain-containing protein [Galdieria sulphuraria]